MKRGRPEQPAGQFKMINKLPQQQFDVEDGGAYTSVDVRHQEGPNPDPNPDPNPGPNPDLNSTNAGTNADFVAIRHVNHTKQREPKKDSLCPDVTEAERILARTEEAAIAADREFEDAMVKEVAAAAAPEEMAPAVEEPAPKVSAQDEAAIKKATNIARREERKNKRAVQKAIDKLEREALLPPKTAVPAPEAHVILCSAFTNWSQQLSSCDDHSSQWKITVEQIGGTGRMRYNAECDKCNRTEVRNMTISITTTFAITLTIPQP